jgi:hypothetical protein
MFIYFHREQADNENFASSGAVILPVGPRSKCAFVEALDWLRPVEPLVGDFDHAFNHLNADAHYPFIHAVIAPVMPVARPCLAPGLVPI